MKKQAMMLQNLVDYLIYYRMIGQLSDLKDQGADAVKFLLYFDVDEDKKINEYKNVFMERIGSECMAEDIPFFLRNTVRMMQIMMM